MEPNQVQSDQGEKPWRYQDGRRHKVGNIKRVEKRRINQDWDYLQSEQLPNNAPTDKIFNASYQNQGLQPQNFSDQGTDEIGYKGSNSNVRNRQNARQATGARRHLTGRALSATEKDANMAGRRLMSRGMTMAGTRAGASIRIPMASDALARTKAMGVNLKIWGILAGVWFIQVGIAIFYAVSFAILLTLESDPGWIVSVADWWYGIKEIAMPVFVISGIISHFYGILVLTLIYLAYSGKKLKPLSGNKAILKQAAFVAALLLYTTPLLSIGPWVILVMIVVSLYPE